MKLIMASLCSVFFLASCGQSHEEMISKPSIGKPASAGNQSVAYFAEGCFWHSEYVFESLVGVSDAVSGYAGGTETNPNYEQVCAGATGHAEAVQVFYDPSQISYETLVKAFFASQDPTTLIRQGNDVGTQYRSVAFYTTASEKNVIEMQIKNLTDEKKYPGKIVTEVKPFTTFYKAEDYHQQYIEHNPENSYVRNVSIPDFIEFKNNFQGNFK